MALKFVDGFEFWTVLPGCWTTYDTGSGGNVPTVAASILTIPNGVAPTFTSSHVRWTFPANYTTVIINVRIAFNVNTFFTDVAFLTLFDGNDFQMTVGTNSAGQIWVKRGDANGTQVGTFSTFAVNLDNASYYDVECKLTPANSGAAIIQVNGVEVLNVSGDLAATANEYANGVALGKTVTTTQIPGIKVDHILIMDTSGAQMNDFIGPVKVVQLPVLADGNYTDWTALAGDRWDAINDAAPDGDTTYIESNVVGEKYTADATNLAASVTDIVSFAVWSNAKRDDAATRGYKILLRKATVDDLSVDENFVGSTYTYFVNAYDVSPFTAIAWTPTEVNSLEVGVQVTT